MTLCVIICIVYVMLHIIFWFFMFGTTVWFVLCVPVYVCVLSALYLYVPRFLTTTKKNITRTFGPHQQ